MPDEESYLNPKYLMLKLQKQLDVVRLRNLLTIFIEGDNSIGISVKWLDLAEILLKVDGSWDKNPQLYMKYTTTGMTPEEYGRMSPEEFEKESGVNKDLLELVEGRHPNSSIKCTCDKCKEAFVEKEATEL